MVAVQGCAAADGEGDLTNMFYLIFELFFLVIGMFLQEPQLLIAAGAFAIAEELYDIERMLTDGRKELLTDTDVGHKE